MQKNGFPGIHFDLVIDGEDNTLEIIASKDVPYGFGRILGVDKGIAHSTAAAKVLPVLSVSHGIRPFALPDMPLVFGAAYTLKEGGGDGYTGNYGAIALGGNGASNYLDNIVEGFDGRLMAGDLIDTEPGNMSGPTINGVTSLLADCTHSPPCTVTEFEPDCARLIQ